MPIYVIQHHRAPELCERALEHLETLLHDEPKTARVMPIGVHPYIVGQPHRFPYYVEMLEHLKSTLGVRFMTGGEVFDWYKASAPQPHAASTHPKNFVLTTDWRGIHGSTGSP